MRIQESIYLGVSLVLSFTDEFTGQIISDPGLKVKISEASGSLRKQEGYYVFTGVPGERAQVTVESPWYCTERFEVPIRREGELLEVQKLRLYPASGHPLVREATCVYGKAKPNEMIAACCPAAGDYRKLLLDVKKGEEKLVIYSREDEDLEGNSFYLMKGSSSWGEIIELGALMKQGMGMYWLKAPLKENYGKIEARLCILHRTRADAEGNYFLPLSRGGNGNREYLFRRQQKNNKKPDEFKVHILEEGVKNRLDWEETPTAEGIERRCFGWE